MPWWKRRWVKGASAVLVPLGICLIDDKRRADRILGIYGHPLVERNRWIAETLASVAASCETLGGTCRAMPEHQWDDIKTRLHQMSFELHGSLHPPSTVSSPIRELHRHALEDCDYLIDLMDAIEAQDDEELKNVLCDWHVAKVLRFAMSGGALPK